MSYKIIFNFIRKKKNTNFEELLENYNEIDIPKSQEIEDIVFELKDVYNYYKQKLFSLQKEIENTNKLYVYRFKKIKEIIQIYKILEIEADIIYYFKEFIQIQLPDEDQKEMFNKKCELTKKIVKLRKDD